MTTMTYPILKINQRKLYENAQKIVALCANANIEIAGVIKGVNGDLSVAEAFMQAGCVQAASSRTEQLKAFKAYNPNWETLLLRIPMASEVEAVVKYADYTLVSEIETINALNASCEKQGKNIKVVLMADLGDLREGYFDAEELVKAAVYAESLENVTLAGIGTNLGCYGAIKPTQTNLEQLAKTAEMIEARIGRELEIVSGGATSSLPLIVSGEMPKKINHLRVGEGILLNMDLPEIWGVNVGDLHQDAFTLEAQIIEIKDKPSHPVGEIFIDAFGNTPEYPDRGIRRRAILAAGKQDFVMEDKLVPKDPGVSVIGSSSDHLIVEINESLTPYKIGDTMAFTLYYGPMLHLSTCPWVGKVVEEPIDCASLNQVHNQQKCLSL